MRPWQTLHYVFVWCLTILILLIIIGSFTDDADGLGPTRCHVEVTERTRRTAEIVALNDGYGARCVTIIDHRCGRYLTVHRRIVTTRHHRLTTTIDCGTLRLHHLEVTVR